MGECSTVNVSQSRNRPRRVAIPFRPWTKVQWLLHKHGVTNRDVSDESGVPLATVNRSLSIKHFKKTNYASVSKVRRAVQVLLTNVAAEGCLGTEYLDFDDWWIEYDEMI